MPPRKRKPDPADTPAGARVIDAQGRPVTDPKTGLPVLGTGTNPDPAETPEDDA